MEKKKLKLGEKIRKFRQDRNMNLTRLSELTSIAQSTLSKIENDVISPGFDKVVSICRGLEIDISDLLSEKEGATSSQPMARMTVTRKGDGETVSSDTYTSRYLCNMISKKGMIPMIVDVNIRDGEETESQMIRHAGEDYIYVLEGTVKVLLEHYAPVVLDTGDSMYFDSAMGHLLVAVGKKPARVLGVTLSAE
ncbi:XRE family transcriptional regulator [Emcibacter sp.]|uniref:helix-turn-helix domain-containing protein n=1 Tax=Emcibacter sp. TaxID=1979954 RepID=UPI002AA5E650|nr:XRE family transcriptional regulator [Emcibacter sp.]